MRLLMLTLMVNFILVREFTLSGMGEVSGLYFAKNIFSKGAVRVGSKIGPDYQNVFLSNQFVDSSVDIGISQPGQFQVRLYLYFPFRNRN